MITYLILGDFGDLEVFFQSIGRFPCPCEPGHCQAAGCAFAGRSSDVFTLSAWVAFIRLYPIHHHSPVRLGLDSMGKLANFVQSCWPWRLAVARAHLQHLPPEDLQTSGGRRGWDVWRPRGGPRWIPKPWQVVDASLVTSMFGLVWT